MRHENSCSECGASLRTSSSGRRPKDSPSNRCRWTFESAGFTAYVFGLRKETTTGCVASTARSFPLERFSLTNAWENEDGTTGPETLLSVSFEDRGQQTKLDLHQTEFDSLESRDGHMSGWEETLDQLPGYLKTLSPDAGETER